MSTQTDNRVDSDYKDVQDWSDHGGEAPVDRYAHCGPGRTGSAGRRHVVCATEPPLHVAIVEVAQMCSKRCPSSNLRTLQSGCRKVAFPRISSLPTGSDLRRPGSYAWTFASAKNRSGGPARPEAALTRPPVRPATPPPTPVGGFDSRPPPLRCGRTNPGRDEERLDGRPALDSNFSDDDREQFLDLLRTCPQKGGADLMLELHEVLIRERGGRVR